MSETVTRQRPSVDLDAFERRFRQTQHSAHDDDPLAELARIVGDEPDPYGDVFAQQPLAPAHQDLRHQDLGHQDLRASYAPHGRQEPSLGGAAPRFFADFAAIEAGLRAASPQPQLHPQVAPGHDAQPDYAEPDYAFPPEHEVGALPGPADWEQPRGAARAPARQKPVYGIAAAIVIAVAGIGVAFAYKGTGSSPREIKTIMAAAGPTKIQPPADAEADAANQDNAAQGQAAPTKLVSREEQPVDLQQAVQDNSARDGRGTDASSVPVPPSPGEGSGTMSPDYGSAGTQSPDTASTGTASPSYGDQGFGVGMPLPKKVKSVSVKPDGTIVPGAQDDAPVATPSPAPDRIGALAEDTAPAPVAPKHVAKSKSKSTTRVAALNPPPVDATGDAADAPAPKPTKPAHKAKPVQVATAETGTDQAPANEAKDDAKPAGSGTFAVQLAAPGSESDAKSATTRLLKKYSGALHGRRLGFHRADSNGHTVYRVRVSSLSKEDATSLCSKLKADGGSCFVAKN